MEEILKAVENLPDEAKRQLYEHLQKLYNEADQETQTAVNIALQRNARDKATAQMNQIPRK